MIEAAGHAAIDFAALAFDSVEPAVFVGFALVVAEVAFAAARVLQIVIVVTGGIGVADGVVADSLLSGSPSSPTSWNGSLVWMMTARPHRACRWR